MEQIYRDAIVAVMSVMGGLLLIIGYFAKRILNSVDRTHESLEALRVDITGNYVKKSELKEDFEELEAKVAIRIKLCEAQQQRRMYKGASV